MSFTRYAGSEQQKREERPLMLLLAQIEDTLGELDDDSPWRECLVKARGGIRRGLGLPGYHAAAAAILPFLG
jgi:hypothetical protein